MHGGKGLHLHHALQALSLSTTWGSQSQSTSGHFGHLPENVGKVPDLQLMHGHKKTAIS